MAAAADGAHTAEGKVMLPRPQISPKRTVVAAHEDGQREEAVVVRESVGLVELERAGEGAHGQGKGVLLVGLQETARETRVLRLSGGRQQKRCRQRLRLARRRTFPLQGPNFLMPTIKT